MLGLVARAAVLGVLAVVPVDACSNNDAVELRIDVGAHGSVADAQNPNDWECDPGVSGMPSGFLCRRDFRKDVIVTMRADPHTGYHFTGWGGACSGTGTCQVRLSASRQVTARFAPGSSAPQAALEITVDGAGRVLDRREGRICASGTCTQHYAVGARVLLMAQHNLGDVFLRWTGACAKSPNVPVWEVCEVPLAQSTATTAVFASSTGRRAPPATPPPTTSTTPTTPAPAPSTPKSWGVAEDASKYADDGGADLYSHLSSLGMSLNRWTLIWDGRNADGSTESGFLDRALAAKPAGVQVILSLYPDPAAFTKNADGTRAAPDSAFVNGFCSWAGKVAARYSGRIGRYIVLNEPNLATFWPTTNRAATVEQTLAACYDSIKAASPGAVVAGLGLSARAPSASSTPPIDLIAQIGAAYKGTRSAPLFDELAIHPYPPQDKALTPTPAPTAPAAGYSGTPGFYGLSTLKRVKDAVNTAFAGTGQKTVAQGLKLLVDEYAYQVNMEGDGRYTGSETSSTVPDQKTQADYLATAVNRYLACDADVADVLFFHLVDERELGTWQSGLQEVDGTHRQSFDAVGSAIRQGCTSQGPTFP